MRVKCKITTRTPEPIITKLLLIWLEYHYLYCAIIKQLMLSSTFPSLSPVAGELSAKLPHTIDVHEMLVEIVLAAGKAHHILSSN